MSHVQLKNIQVSLGRTPILKGIDLDIQKGQFVSLLGPSGCGKSTLLKAVAGLLKLTSGQVLIGQNDVTKLPPEKRNTVIVFQDLRLFPHLSVEQNVAFGLKMQGCSKQQRSAVAQELLDKVGLAGYGSRKVSELSGGQQQRVALSRALAIKPELLLLDEPFSSLDEHLRQKMRDLVMLLHQDLGLTTLLVTHDQAEALTLSSKIAVMFDGQLQQVDTPRNVYERPATAAVAQYFSQLNYMANIINSQWQFNSASVL